MQDTCLVAITGCNLIVRKIWSIPFYLRSTLLGYPFVAAKKKIGNRFSL